jgi:triosephosphate isomerase
MNNLKVTRKSITVINFKTYPEATGKNALKLAKVIEKVDKDIIIGVQETDIYLISEKTKLQVYAQHVDSGEPGRNTGFIFPGAVKKAGAKGVFLNHSEHKLSLDEIKKTFRQCRKVGLKVLIFAKDLREARIIEKLKPDYLVIEPPELVAGSKSVSQEKPQLIEKISKNIKMKFLVGAGIKNGEDVKVALKLGASGIAVASGVIKAKNPGRVLKGLVC